MIPDEAIVAEFQSLHERIYGRVVDTDKARELAHRLLALYDLLLRPRPKGKTLTSDSGDR
ncbi:MAG TPA: hypothetical protein VHU23_00800 [Rhizomicrobium sp.]|jgi:hypothetical protein|nr:hypothetical protein [Rhizomicrobium sp.]